MSINKEDWNKAWTDDLHNTIPNIFRQIKLLDKRVKYLEDLLENRVESLGEIE